MSVQQRDGEMMSWSVRKAKAHFSALLDASIKDGPQCVTRRGLEIAVVVSTEQWQRLQQQARPTLKELLLAPEPRFEGGLPYPERRSWRWRAKPRLQ